MKITEKGLFQLEKELIKKHKKVFGNLRPRLVKIVDDKTFDGRASKNNLLINRGFLKKSDLAELEDLLLHEICHYLNKDQGHNTKFISDLGKIGSSVDIYENTRNYEEEARTIGMISYENKKGKMIEKFGVLPRWKTFDCTMYEWEHVGVRYGVFRKRYCKLSIENAARMSGIISSEIKKIEKAENDLRYDKSKLTDFTSLKLRDKVYEENIKYEKLYKKLFIFYAKYYKKHFLKDK